jgi:hypothetical protein
MKQNDYDLESDSCELKKKFLKHENKLKEKNIIKRKNGKKKK